MLVTEPKRVVKTLCILLIFACCLPLAACGHSGPNPVSCPYPLRQLAMSDDKTGWGLSLANEVLYTDNGIEDFETVRGPLPADTSSNRFASAAFVNARTAYTAYFSSADNQIIVEHTSDSGASWQQTRIDFADYADISDAGQLFLGFSDEAHGYLLCCSTPACGQMSKLLFRTDDAGETFSYTANLTGTIAGYPQGIAAVNGEKLYIAVSCRGNDSYLYQSQDCAKTWEPVEIFQTRFKAGNVGYVDGYAPVFGGAAFDSGTFGGDAFDDGTFGGDALDISTFDGGAFYNKMQNGAVLLKIAGGQIIFQLFITKDGGEHWTPYCKIPCKNMSYDDTMSPDCNLSYSDNMFPDSNMFPGDSILSYSVASDGSIYMLDPSGHIYRINPPS